VWPWIHFDREASSLEEAIHTAVAQVQAAGFLVSKVELDVASAVSLGA
jgi:mannitol/fructose-specific phosphotransferase system IIA component (Ntr-type)